MTGPNRHATDRIDAVIQGECPAGCQSWVLEATRSKNELAEFLPEALLTCSHCGAQMDTIRKTTPSEVLD